MLGSDDALEWNQGDDALVITRPAALKTWKVTGFRIEFK